MKADKKKTLRLLKTVRGQMDGIMKMVEEDRYCIDISHQLISLRKDMVKQHEGSRATIIR